jgi:hypothetical protein
MEAIDRNLEYLRQILRSESWQMLRRNPPVFAAPADALASTRAAVLGYLQSNWLREPPALPPEPVRWPFEGASRTK